MNDEGRFWALSDFDIDVGLLGCLECFWYVFVALYQGSPMTMSLRSGLKCQGLLRVEETGE